MNANTQIHLLFSISLGLQTVASGYPHLLCSFFLHQSNLDIFMQQACPENCLLLVLGLINLIIITFTMDTGTYFYIILCILYPYKPIFFFFFFLRISCICTPFTQFLPLFLFLFVYFPTHTQIQGLLVNYYCFTHAHMNMYIYYLTYLFKDIRAYFFFMYFLNIETIWGKQLRRTDSVSQVQSINFCTYTRMN